MMRKVFLIGFALLFSFGLSSQTLWGGYLMNMQSKNNDSVSVFNANSVRTFTLGNSFLQFAGPATTVKTWTGPNANATLLTDNAAVTVAQGGTGQTSYTVGDILQASASTTLSKLNSVATGNALISGGVATTSTWGKIGLTTHISGTLAGGNGGTNNAFMDFTGPASSIKTFTLPNASSTILTSNAAVTIGQGGTGTGSTLTGLLLGNASAFTAITSSTVGQIPRVTGSNTFAFGALDLADADAVTGVLPFANGGQDIVHGRATGQTAANSSIATLTVGGSDATYMVSGNILITTDNASQSFSLKVAYTDEGNTARDYEFWLMRIGTSAITTSTLGGLGTVPYPATPIHIRCKASTSITIKTTGTFTGVTYSAEGVIERKK